MAAPGPSKHALRATWRRHRRAALAAAATGILEAALRELPPRLPPGRHLALYWPLAGEPDLRPLAGSVDVPLALPAIVPWTGDAPGAAAGRRLVYRPWHPDGPLVPDACGIPAPPAPAAGQEDPLPPTALGLLLVPALAIDHGGVRLGSGGGWYDRLRADPTWRSVQALAVLPAACVTAALPRDPWDVPFDGWLDERGVHGVAATDGKVARL